MKLIYSSLVALLAPLLLVLSCMMERWGIGDSKVSPYITLSPPQYMTTHYEESRKRQLIMILPPVLFLLFFMHHYYLLLGWDPVLTNLPSYACSILYSLTHCCAVWWYTTAECASLTCLNDTVLFAVCLPCLGVSDSLDKLQNHSHCPVSLGTTCLQESCPASFHKTWQWTINARRTQSLSMPRYPHFYSSLCIQMAFKLSLLFLSCTCICVNRGISV